MWCFEQNIHILKKWVSLKTKYWIIITKVILKLSILIILQNKTMASGDMPIHRHPRGSNVTFYAKYTHFLWKYDYLIPKSWIIMTKVILLLNYINIFFKINNIASGGKCIYKHPRGPNVTFWTTNWYFDKYLVAWTPKYWIIITKVILKLKNIKNSS